MGGTRSQRTTDEGGLHSPKRYRPGVPPSEFDSSYYDKLVAQVQMELRAKSEAEELNRVALGSQAVVRHDWLRPVLGYSAAGDTPQVIVSYTVPPGFIFHWRSIGLQFNPPDFHNDKMLRWRLTQNSGQIPGLQDVPPGPSGHDNFYGQDVMLWSESKELFELFIPGDAVCSIEVSVSDVFEHFCAAVGIISGRVYMPISLVRV